MTAFSNEKAQLSKFFTSSSTILSGHCNAALEHKGLLQNISSDLNNAVIYAHMSYCMTPSLILNGGYDSKWWAGKRYGKKTQDEIDAVNDCGNYIKIVGSSMSENHRININFYGRFEVVK